MSEHRHRWLTLVAGFVGASYSCKAQICSVAKCMRTRVIEQRRGENQ